MKDSLIKRKESLEKILSLFQELFDSTEIQSKDYMAMLYTYYVLKGMSQAIEEAICRLP